MEIVGTGRSDSEMHMMTTTTTWRPVGHRLAWTTATVSKRNL